MSCPNHHGQCNCGQQAGLAMGYPEWIKAQGLKYNVQEAQAVVGRCNPAIGDPSDYLKYKDLAPEMPKEAEESPHVTARKGADFLGLQGPERTAFILGWVLAKAT